MADRVDLYSAYRDFTQDVLDAVRKETFGIDIGQNSWLTVDEHDRFLSWLELRPEQHVLELASGSGGPALYMANRCVCRVTGMDVNEGAVATATQLAARANLGDRVRFVAGDANAPLPFEDSTFDGVICIDSLNHLADRRGVLGEIRRVLRPGRRAVVTDPVVITGPITNEELAVRGSIGLFLYVPPGVNERLIEEAGLALVHQQDVSDNCALIAKRWHDARAHHQAALVELEGAERFAGLQKFFWAVHRLTDERRLSRFVYVVEKPSRGP
ncbi:MAG TPA: class I SAM-dependent methyltransferase [Kofleriaceae bacterium]|nr:class I SAM-dependent methyltransferase [Kofleriaceae bacterium]